MGIGGNEISFITMAENVNFILRNGDGMGILEWEGMGLKSYLHDHL